MKPPSFEPWLARVRMARVASAILGCIVVSTMSYDGGAGWDDALLRGLISAIVCYFVGWAGSLWICSELYQAHISKLKGKAEMRMMQRQMEIQDIYEQQVLAGLQQPDASQTTPLRPPASGTDQKAA